MPLRRARRGGHEQHGPETAGGGSPAAARVAAVTLLARRDHASGELRDKLEARGFEPQAAAEAIAGLAAEGTVNDARYAQNYVAYHAARGQGPIRIGTELRACHLPQELIDAALEGGPDWAALAREVRRRRFGREPPGNWRETARQARFLQYRGFSADHIRAATGVAGETD